MGVAMINYPFAIIAVIYVGSFTYLYLRCRDHLPFHKYLSNHVLLLAPLNFLFTYFTAGRQGAVFETKSVPGLDKIKANYPVIRAEAKVLLDTGVFQRPPSVDEPGYNTFEKGGWRMYPLKWYTKECRGTAVMMCPRTCAILNSIPTIRSAMFTALPPGAKPEQIFASKKIYKMQIEMPNLNSATGSWILNFTEFRTDPNATRVSSNDLNGPNPIRKVDPKYPRTLINEHVEGEVVLYAVIRRDGSVDSIQLVRGVDEELDKNAMNALSQWKFRPATRQGEPVELEAIIYIPFHAPDVR